MHLKFLILVIVAWGMIFTFLIFRQVHEPHEYETDLAKIKISKNLPNIPEILLQEDPANLSQGHNISCAAKHPGLFDLEFNNDVWQTQRTSNGTFQLFSAYYDQRLSHRMVRVISMYDRFKPVIKMHCQLWYASSKLEVVEPQPLHYIWRYEWEELNGTQGVYRPYLISCPLPTSEVPIAVSLVERPCDQPTNSLRVHQKETKKDKNFVVCVKGLNFPYQDETVRFAEWIELLRLLGADKVNFYEFSIPPNIKKLLEYYEEKGFVELSKITLVGPYSNDAYIQSLFLHKKQTERRMQEVIPYNDCLYKHKDESRYVVLLDTDEIIVPRSGNWIDLLRTLEKHHRGEGASCYAAQNIYFWDDLNHQHNWFEGIPSYMYMLQHVYRARNYPERGNQIKAFHDTDLVMSLHNHFPRSCIITERCPAKGIDKELALLHHYRKDCVEEFQNTSCKNLKEDIVMDTALWRFKDELIVRVEKTLLDLGFLKEPSNTTSQN